MSGELDRALAEDRQSRPWESFLRDNPKVAPLVSAYLSGGARPDETALGGNHYALARVLQEDVRRTLEPEPEPELPFAEASLTNPLVVTAGPGQAEVVCAAGQDVLIDCGMQPRGSLIVSGSPRNVQIRSLYSRVTAPFSTGKFGRGALHIHAKAQHVSVTDWFCEGTATLADVLTIACAPKTRVTVQRFRLETPSDSQEPEEHCDVLQTQGAVGRIELGFGTAFVPGVRPPNHGGKGLQLDVLGALGETGGPYSVDVRSVDFTTQAAPSGARSALVIGKDDGTQIQLDLSEVYISGPLPFDAALVNYPAALQKQSTGSSPNRVVTFPANTQGWRGEVRERAPGTHFVTREMLLAA